MTGLPVVRYPQGVGWPQGLGHFKYLHGQIWFGGTAGNASQHGLILFTYFSLFLSLASHCCAGERRNH